MRIAIVGGGISGLTAALLLHRRHEITLFESDSRIGGHSHTVDVKIAARTYPVDTGFIVFNDRTYPKFERIIEALGVVWRPSDMSFGVRDERDGLEYCGSSLKTLFAQRRNLLRPRFWKMLREIVRFNKVAPTLLEAPDDDPSLDEFLQRHGFGGDFVDKYLVPMGSAIWSAEPGDFGAMPARFFIRFFVNHGLLSLDNRPQWRTIVGGSREYVAKLTAPFAERIRRASPIERIARDAEGVTIVPRGGAAERFEHVVIAAHADDALAMLADPTPTEAALLAAFPYRDNECVLHTDEKMLPRARDARASWNYHVLPAAEGPAALTYWMNRLQSIDAPCAICVTLNRTAAIDPGTIVMKQTYRHPVFTRAGVAAQTRHHEVQAANRTSYCGAYWRNGFHEDGVASAWSVVEALGIDPEEELEHLAGNMPATVAS